MTGGTDLQPRMDTNQHQCRRGTNSQSGRLRILAVVPTPYVFGLQVVTLDFFSRLKQWADCHFLITRWNDGVFPRRLEAMGIPYTTAWMGMFSRKLDARNLKMTLECAYKAPGLFLAFWRLVRRFRPDVIYTANNHELILLYPMLRLLRIPVICHMHDPPPNIPFQRLSFRIWSRPVTRFVAIAENVRDRLLQFPMEPGRVTVLHNGTDLARFPRREHRDGRFARQFCWPEDAFIAGIAGQMHDRKGHLDLLEALDQVRVRVPTLRVVIGGKQEGAYFEQLRAFVEEKGLADRIGFCGWMKNAKDFYEGIDVFVLASRHEEGFGLVLAEAMAVGVPVIATKSGGAVNVVEDGISGLMVDRCAPSEIAEALMRLHGNTTLKTSLIAGGRRSVERDFDLDRQAEKLFALLEETSGQARG